MLCFRLLQDDQPTSTLAEAVTALHGGRAAAPIHKVDPFSFRQIPNAPFAYWVSERIRRIFTELPAFEDEGRTVKVGLQTSDDFRFVRTSWETPTHSKKATNRTWFPFAKGGSYSPFYADVFLEVNWGLEGAEIRLYGDPDGIKPSSRPQNTNFYLRPGLTWPRRTQSGLALRAMRAGCVFADKGPAVFVEGDNREQLRVLLALSTSQPFRALVEIQMAFGSYEVGVIQRTALPGRSDPRLSQLAFQAWSAKRQPDTANLTSHAFVAPALKRGNESLAEDLADWSALMEDSRAKVAAAQAEIDDIAFALYGIEEEDRTAIEALLANGSPAENEDAGNEEEEPDALTTANANGPQLVSSLLDYTLGTTLGRWDIRYATGERQPPELPDPFDPLPVCPPGMLQGEDGLPLSEAEFRKWHQRSEDVPSSKQRSEGVPPSSGSLNSENEGETPSSLRFTNEGGTPSLRSYPLDIVWSGILVDDEKHPDDIVTRVHEALRVIWGDGGGSDQGSVTSDQQEDPDHRPPTTDHSNESEHRPLATANSIEVEACEILEVKSLREYFRKPNKFFASHLARYSKSRRKAPIYWPLSTESGDFTLWLYYHRLDDQTLLRCVNRIEQKEERVTAERDALANREGRSTQEDTQLQALNTELAELRSFKNSLEAIAKFWKPDLNDGVQITAAPLWEHFRDTQWRKALRTTWQALERGDYDWAHLAHSIWPERVVPKCAQDRSLAIAHGHESRLWHEVEKGTGKNKKTTLEWQPVPNADEVAAEILNELKAAHT